MPFASCAYHEGDRYCQIPGTMCLSTKPGPSTIWYCRFHIAGEPHEKSQLLHSALRGSLNWSVPDWRAEAIVRAQKTRAGLNVIPADDQDVHDMLAMARESLKAVVLSKTKRETYEQRDDKELLDQVAALSRDDFGVPAS